MKRATETQQLADWVGMSLEDRRGRNDAYVCVPVPLLQRVLEKIEELESYKTVGEQSEREQLIEFLLPRYSEGLSYIKNRFANFSTDTLRTMAESWGKEKPCAKSQETSGRIPLTYE